MINVCQFINQIFKYPKAFSMDMPTGPGLYYEKSGNSFKIKSMLASGRPSSLECLEWLQWEQARCPHDGVIQHAFNYGEKNIAGHNVDGFLELKNPDGSNYTVAYQYYGCYWHFCPNQCTKSKATHKDGLEDKRIEGLISREVDYLIVKRSCEWKLERQVMPLGYKSPDFCFLGRERDQPDETKITEDLILENIRNGKFFGMIRADVQTPPDVIEKYEHLNFPLIFRKCVITEDMLGEKMKNLAKVGKKDFPKETRTLTWNAADLILTTPTVKQYLELGMVISNITWAVEYKPTKPFTNFVDGMVQVRIDAEKTGNKPLGERAKFCLNSCVGRFG